MGTAHAFDWSHVPKQALIDALRNCQIGPTNLSRQDKADLVALAEQSFERLNFEKASALADAIARETYFRKTGRDL